mmetsp:Transcript_8811/g.25274  ORF Transcript_8811/g.25274 Transcript_8811/m.25274 type:complete len:217 (-) Transcript_8811:116-766(-)
MDKGSLNVTSRRSSGRAWRSKFSSKNSAIFALASALSVTPAVPACQECKAMPSKSTWATSPSHDSTFQMQLVAARLSTGKIISFVGKRPDKITLINVLLPALTGPMKTMRSFSCCSTRRAKASILGAKPSMLSARPRLARPRQASLNSGETCAKVLKSRCTNRRSSCKRRFNEHWSSVKRRKSCSLALETWSAESSQSPTTASTSPRLHGRPSAFP